MINFFQSIIQTDSQARPSIEKTEDPSRGGTSLRVRLNGKEMCKSIRKLVLFQIILLGLSASIGFGQVTILEKGESKVLIIADTKESTPAGATVLEDAGNWLAQSLQKSSGAEFPVTTELSDAPSIVVSTKANWPQVAKDAGFTTSKYDAYAIVTKTLEKRIYVLGNSEESARFGVADLLRRWGFRWYAPSPKWHVAPKLEQLSLDLNIVESPPLMERRIWYAYGMSGDDLRPLMTNYQRWASANRLTVRGLTRTGHSYGSIINRNKEAFANNPELSAMKKDGTSDVTSVPNARKFCFTNPDLIELVAQDRWKLLEENRRAIPASFMVSMDPSDGEGTCYCEDCQKIGTTTDRVLHLANETAKRLRKKDPNAWVGLYAYSSHRLPPTIDIEPNIYVQVALGFNRTQYSLPELVDLWSRKVKAIGLREYYGVEAWDWGLPGRARGGRVNYHRKWIPYYAKRNLNGVNAETNANWGAQALGLYVASQLLWNPATEVDPLLDEYFGDLFGNAAKPMRSFYEKMEAAPALRAATLLPLFEDLNKAWELENSQEVRDRLTDLKAYLIYVTEFRNFDQIRNRSKEHGDKYHDALYSLMNYTWRIRHRDTVHYYALARRLCNALPLKDGRPEYSIARGNQPIWKKGENLTDAEVSKLYQKAQQALEGDGDPTVHFSRYLDPVKLPGRDVGPSRIHARPREDAMAVSRFRRGMLGYLVPRGKTTVKLGISPESKPVTLTVYMRNDAIFEKEFKKTKEQTFQPAIIDLPRAFEYKVEITGNFEIEVPPEAPLLFEASVTNPAWIDYSGPHYFYVPRGTKELIVDTSPRLSLNLPDGRKDLHTKDREEGKSYIHQEVPEGLDGQLWSTTTLTRGSVVFLNTPPLLSFHRNTMFVPRELSESEGLGTQE